MAAEAQAASSSPANAVDESHDNAMSAPENAVNEGEAEAEAEVDPAAEAVINLTILLPDPEAEKMQIMVSTQEQVHEIRQSIIDLPQAFQYTCFHLEFQGQKINDFIPLAEIPDLGTEPEFRLVPDPYTEKEARIHLGILPGLSLYESVTKNLSTQTEGSEEQPLAKDYDFQATPSITTLIPEPIEPAPKTVKMRGHLLYIVVTTNEGEQFQVTAHVSGFFVNKSSNAKFDPFPRPAPKGQSSHSLLKLIELLSPSFSATFKSLQEHNGQRDPLATFQITNAIPNSPWALPSPSSTLCTHSPDITRPQETYLLAGVDNTDTLRDWNEEFQSAKELPKESVQDRVFRERLTSKLFADYNDAAVKGAVLIAHGEIAPLNPTETRDAQIFVYNNIFYSFGADGVGTFTSEGGDEAARVATGKDVAGVQLVNQLDIDGLFTPATVVVDYLGKRIVGQSIVPGIFKQREPGEHQIDYGAVDGKDVVAIDERFTAPFSQLSKALKVKEHPVWDKDGKRFDLEASVETKGLMGTDGRKYVLDLYRITPFDVAWREETEAAEYPHRMTVLRPELVDSFGRYKMKQWIDVELARRAQPKSEDNSAEAKEEDKEEDKEETKEAKEEAKDEAEGEAKEENEVAKPDAAEAEKNQPNLADFKFALNPDAFSGQTPRTEEEKAELEADEQEVRAAGEYLRDRVIPEFLRELTDSDISFPMDGQSLGRILHKRGINIRYLGKITTLAVNDRLRCLREICIQDMVARAFKHVSATYLRSLPAPFAPSCVSHLLNCLLGHRFNAKPTADIDSSFRELYSDADLSFESVTPETLREEIEQQVLKRFRYQLPANWFDEVRPVQLLRDICIRAGIQVLAKDYAFESGAAPAEAPVNAAQPEQTNGQTNSETKSKKKKKAARESSPTTPPAPEVVTTFTPDDVLNVVPVVKHSCPRSSLAEEALEAGRISILQNQKKLGQELLLESLSLHEQIYGILHPEVAKVYNSLSMLYYQLDDKEVAVELARKAIIVSERTGGVDSAETLLNYLNLSLFLHQVGDSKSALAYSIHALKLWKIIYGPGHPDSITTINNAAVMLQGVKAYHESRLWFEESLRVCDSVFGRQSINSATLLFQLAQALALDHDSKAAVNRMRESYNIFLAELGPEDKNTKEAESWLEQLTQNAVSIAKHAKDVQARRLRSGIKFPVATAAQTAGVVPQRGAASQIDSRSIDELLKFIEGDTSKTGSKKRPGRGNPKRRGATK
ncbi:clustered mitochondria domain-containing protein [Trichoderma breve]|uniref:Clustered mitochondria protein homolog n=1 Tax=Trichoderma breve TaxID=2034170 RepID=A0A9W9BBB5_9HYPO|nr:clustered mitochondria domain-containing protein [Trichoderma breve]KAJ4860108.1 clustered mitochondria domain-containing protein [Trichoderma breve]